MKKARTAGFTLAELLITLAILACITVFFIPKIMTSNQNAQRNAVFKETLSAFSAIIGQGRATGTVSTATGFHTYLQSRLNAVKNCANASVEGCWDSASQGSHGGQDAGPGYVLHNGANVTGVDLFVSSATLHYTFFIIDWNGSKPPNVLGEDQLSIMYCLGSEACSGMDGSGTKAPGSFGPSGTGSLALYSQIYN